MLVPSNLALMTSLTASTTIALANSACTTGEASLMTVKNFSIPPASATAILRESDVEIFRSVAMASEKKKKKGVNRNQES